MEWIDFSENSKPADGQEVICWNGIKPVMAIFKDGKNYTTHEFKVQKYATLADRCTSSTWANVTKWMPLPKDPV